MIFPSNPIEKTAHVCSMKSMRSPGGTVWHGHDPGLARGAPKKVAELTFFDVVKIGGVPSGK